MLIAKKTFSKGMNTDMSPKLLGEGMYLNLQNARVGVSEDGRNGRIENVRGTLEATTWTALIPSIGTNISLGSATDDANKRIIGFNYNSNGNHGIYCFEKNTGTAYIVILSSQVVGGLNFNPAFRIDRNARVVNGLLYFTDGSENGERKINIDAGIKLNHGTYSTTAQSYIAPIPFSEITLIKPPPALAPSMQKNLDSSFANNFIAADSFSFALQYIYNDNERSVIGAYSPASRLNKADSPNNRITVQMNVGEQVPATVQVVRLVVRSGNVAFVTKTWDRKVAAEAAQITAHNAGTTALSYNFYNDSTGEFIPQGDILKPFDSVPRSSKTLEFAKDRIFLGNNKDGYNSPTVTSLTHTLNSAPVSAVGLPKKLIDLSVIWLSPDRVYRGWYVYLTGTEASPEGYYAIVSTEQYDATPVLPPAHPTPPAALTAPGTVAFTGLAFRGLTQHDVGDFLNVSHGNLGGQIFTNWDFTSTNTSITGVATQVQDVFKSKSQFMKGVVFYDFAMRKCGVVKSTTAISIPARDYSFNAAVQSVVVSVNNTNALAEIPDWAYYYAFVRTLNLKTRFFIQGYDNTLKYATKAATGEYKYDQVAYVTGTVALALDSTALIQAGLGYTFSEGDVCYLIKSSSSSFNVPFELSVIGQDGKYILLKATDIGNLTTVTATYEIYTPYKASEQEPFYEFGHIYKVNNPTTGTRSYSVLSEIMIPDAYVLTRNYMASTYFAEAMSPNDVYYKRWDNDGGKVNYITKLGEVTKTQEFAWSNTYLAGTAVNGLSTFEPLNRKQVPIEIGPLRKLQLADKVTDQGQGNVMLAICETRPVSLYLGEMQLSASAKASDLVRIDEVVGSMNVLKGTGTLNPETVVERFGVIFWVNVQTGEVLQYSANGVDPVSRFNLVRFFRKYCNSYLSTAKSSITTLNGFSHIPTGVDPFNEEFLVTTPALSIGSPTLPSYTGVPSYATSISNRFDLVDNLAKTLAFNYTENGWGSNYDFSPEWYEYLDMSMYAFKGGKLYACNAAANFNTFFGQQKPVRICLTINDMPSADKDLVNIAIEGSVAPDFTVAYSDNPNEQITDLVIDDYKKKGSSFYARFWHDRLSPNVTGIPEKKMMEGDVVTGNPLYVMLEFQQYVKLMYLDAVNVGVAVAKGLTQIIQK